MEGEQRPEPSPAASAPLPRPPASTVRRRGRAEAPRDKRLFPRYSPAEWAAVRAAAVAVGMSPEAWVGMVSVRAATEPVPADWTAMRDELVATRTQVRRLGVLLNQLVAALHARGEDAEPVGGEVVTAAGRMLGRLDDPVARLDALTDRAVRRLR